MPSDAARKPAKPAAPDAHADRPGDDVEVNSDASFPASDPPSWTPVTRVGVPRARER